VEVIVIDDGGVRAAFRTRRHILPPLLAALTFSACASGGAGRSPPFEPPPSVRVGTSEAASGTPATPGTGWTQTGVASWYGDPFHGRRTASGEVYDMDEFTAAHQTLAFGTVIDVANLDNGRSVELRVTDRGPFAKNRVLDVSRAGARALDMMGPGTANIRITIVNPGGDPVAVRGGCVVVQFAAYRDPDAATERVREAGALGFRASVEESDGWYRAIAGPFDSSEGARDATEALGGFIRRCRLDGPSVTFSRLGSWSHRERAARSS